MTTDVPPAIVAEFTVAAPKVFVPGLRFEPLPSEASSAGDGSGDGLVVMQVNDARQSAACFRLGCYETDPEMRPFSHGGTGTMLLGFALQDAVLAVVEPHLKGSVRNLLRVWGSATEEQALVQTSATIRRYDRGAP